MADEYWKNSPFGNESIFHPDYDEKEEELRFQRQQENSKIIGVNVVKGDILKEQLKANKIVGDNLAKEKYTPFNPFKNQEKTDVETITISVLVEVEGWASDVKITLKDSNSLYAFGQERWGKRLLNYFNSKNKVYCAVFSLDFTKTEQSKNLIIISKLTDISEHKVFDSLKKIVNIDVEGNIKELESFNSNRDNEVLDELCDSTIWSSKELTNLVSSVRKKDQIIFQSQYQKNGNPIYVDNDGKPYYNLNKNQAKSKGLKKQKIKTSFFSRDDAFDNKPLKSRIFFYPSNGNNLNNYQSDYNHFALNLNRVFSKYNINTCLRKVHFITQIYVETNRFRTTYEPNPIGNYSGGDFYRGRGMLQLTHDYNYLDYYCSTNQKDYFQKYLNNRLSNKFESVVDFNKRTNNKHISIEAMKEFNDFVSDVSKNIYYACDSAGWYWNINNINKYADKDNLTMVSAKVNNPSVTNSVSVDEINGFTERKDYYQLFKEIFGL